MSFLYLDSSVMVKRYVEEPGSDWVQSLITDPQNVAILSEIAIVEVSAALSMSVRTGRLRKALGRAAYEAFHADIAVGIYQLLAVARPTIDLAAGLAQTHPLKGYDAVHLATGLEAARSLADQEITLVFVSGDVQMLRAAEAEGLTTDDPFLHADMDVEREAGKRN
ncbi:MAG TPA: type II toxin-antitoxin system VapC family toxin [Hyphomicrobiaceae bacterium]|nr:type II toxin-antitoxin system VapC family toxin [Hyphomicrobiaceae bacterium]